MPTKTKGTNGRQTGSGDEADESDLLFGEVMRTYHHESRTVWADLAAWHEAQADPGGELLTWPTFPKGGYPQLMAAFFEAEAAVLLAVMQWFDHPGTPDPNAAPDDPKLQVFLRVMRRAHLAAEGTVRRKFAGAVITGRRRAHNDMVKAGVDLAIESGLRRELGDDAFTLLGISRAAAYRAMKWPKRR